MRPVFRAHRRGVVLMPLILLARFTACSARSWPPSSPQHHPPIDARCASSTATLQRPATPR